MFKRQINYEWQCSIAMLNCQSLKKATKSWDPTKHWQRYATMVFEIGHKHEFIMKYGGFKPSWLMITSV